MAEIKLSPRSRRLLAPAVEAYGDRWQSPLSRASGVSQGQLNKIADGTRQVHDDVEDRVVKALFAEARSMEKNAARVAELVGRILAAREAK